jgi:hypothetical protein
MTNIFCPLFIWNSSSVYANNEDTLTDWVEREDSITNFYEEEPYDSNVYITTYSPTMDTVWITLNPDYTVDSNGVATYTPQNKSNNPNIYKTMLNTWNLFPNPSDQVCHIEFTLYYDEDVHIKVTNSFGQQINCGIGDNMQHLKKGLQHFQINTNNLASGIYYCELSINGNREIRKFSVVH